MQWKYNDESTQAASVNLKLSLEPDLLMRPKPLNYHESTRMRIKGEENILPQELEKFPEFALKNKLVINSKKCYSMLFTRSRNYAFPPEFSVGNKKVLEVKKTLRILGVLLQDDTKWQAQVEEMVRQATNTIWVLRRMRSLGVDQKTLVAYWKSEGRVHLELACPVWHSGLTIAQSQALDRAQRVAMAAITGRWEPSHTSQLDQLGLERLQPRRVRLCRTFAERTARDSRHTDLFMPTGFGERAGKHTVRYRESLSRTATHCNSAVPYLTRLLNSSEQ